jgi:hypothetical protein
VIAAEAVDPDVIIESEPVSVIDTTAELLGRAKPRRPRTRAAGAPGSGAAATPVRGGRTSIGSRKGAAKKPAVSTRRTTSRTRKSSDGDDENRGNR